MSIRYIKYNDIDRKAWDKCIRESKNGIIYAYSWYLDEIAPQWDALVEGDYESVFPLVYNKKYGFNYLYQPFFTQQLGLFSIWTPTTDRLWNFLDAIPKHFKYIDIQLNTTNKIYHPQFELIERPTYRLNLNQPYEAIYKGYSDVTKRNLKKSVKAGLTVAPSVSTLDVINIYKAFYGSMTPEIQEHHYMDFNRVMNAAINKGRAEIYGVYTKENTLCAAACYFISNGIAIYVFGAPTEEGKELGAIRFLMDHFIQNHAEQPLIMDFEGSEIESVAFFYSTFGSEVVPYYRLRRNRLPYPLRWLKK